MDACTIRRSSSPLTITSSCKQRLLPLPAETLLYDISITLDLQQASRQHRQKCCKQALSPASRSSSSATPQLRLSRQASQLLRHVRRHARRLKHLCSRPSRHVVVRRHRIRVSGAASASQHTSPISKQIAQQEYATPTVRTVHRVSSLYHGLQAIVVQILELLNTLSKQSPAAQRQMQVEQQQQRRPQLELQQPQLSRPVSCSRTATELVIHHLEMALQHCKEAGGPTHM